MLSILLAACSTGTSAVAPLEDNGVRPDPDLTVALAEGPELAVPEASECDWPSDDPGELASTGNAPGDIAGELVLWDQCGERVSTYDFFGRYVLVLSTTDGCPDCDDPALRLLDDADAIAERAGVDLIPVIALSEEDAPVPRSAGADYARRLGLKGFPVTADPDRTSHEVLPLEGRTVPGRCLLAPDMEILGCVEDVDWASVFEDWIETDAADG